MIRAMRIHGTGSAMDEHETLEEGALAKLVATLIAAGSRPPEKEDSALASDSPFCHGGNKSSHSVCPCECLRAVLLPKQPLPLPLPPPLQQPPPLPAQPPPPPTTAGSLLRR